MLVELISLLQATIGADFLTKEVMIDDKLVTLQIVRNRVPLPLADARSCSGTPLGRSVSKASVWRSTAALVIR